MIWGCEAQPLNFKPCALVLYCLIIRGGGRVVYLMGVHEAQEAAVAGVRVGVVAHARPRVGRDRRPAVRVRGDPDHERAWPAYTELHRSLFPTRSRRTE